MEKEEIKQKLKEMLVERLQLKISPSQIADDKPLFHPPEGSGGGLDLDSVEALELVVGIEATFGVTVAAGDYKNEFYSIETVADFVDNLMKASL